MKINKKILIPVLVLINTLTVYFWFFPYQKSSDYESLKLVNKALKQQNQILYTTIETDIVKVKRKSQSYPIFKSKFDSLKIIHEQFKTTYEAINTIRWHLLEEVPKHSFYENEKNWAFNKQSFSYRIKPFHYSIPRKILFQQKKLATLSTEITKNQAIILNHLSDKNLKKIVQDSFLIETNKFPKQFRKASLLQSLTLLVTLQNQLKIAEQKIASTILENIEQTIIVNEIKHTAFIPNISARKSVLKKGELFEAEIFLSAIFTHDSLKYFVNDELLPMKNGVAVYNFTPKTNGKKRFSVRTEYKNPLYNNEKWIYRKEFEADVVDCN